MTSSEAKRHSDRIAAQKEKEYLEKKAKEELDKQEKARLELEEKEKAARIAKGLPEDGSLIFKMFGYKDRSFAYDRQEVWRTEDDVKIGTWATRAYWQPSNFYPGQILRILHSHPHTNLDAKYNPNIGEIAMTDVEPVAIKMRWAVVLWTTDFGIFTLPMFTLKGKTGLRELTDERRREYVAMVTEGTTPDSGKLTPWHGHPIIMNVNPELKTQYSDLCYVDLSRPMTTNSFEYLEENAGSIDGDEYVRLISLFKIQIDRWLNKSFKMFEGSPEYDEGMLVIPNAMPTASRQSYEAFEDWKKKMADTEFPGQFKSKQAKSRKFEESKPKSKSGSESTSSGVKKPPGGGHGRGGGRGGKYSRDGGRGGSKVKDILVNLLATMAPMTYASAAKKAGIDPVVTTGVVGGGVSKPKTSPTHSSTKKSSPAPKKPVSAPKKPASASTGLISATRHSLRLEGKPPEIDPSSAKTKFENENFVLVVGTKDKTREGAPIKKRFRRKKETGDDELVAYRADRGLEHFYPGMIIRATASNYQTSFRDTVDELDDIVRKNLDVMVHKDGPIFAKKRPMVVLWKTLMGLVCAPMNSLSAVGMFDESKRWDELISATTAGDEAWPGKTPWAGRPLIFEAYEIGKGQPLHGKCFINLANLIHISFHEELHVKMGRLAGDQYCRLMNAFMFRQHKFLESAFAEYGEGNGLENLLEAWQSQKPGNMLWSDKAPEDWKQMEARMSKKLPKIIDNTGKYTLV
ncbi:hypothetical protein KCU95_g2204, partial [Aureobasidium melanogenum]